MAKYNGIKLGLFNIGGRTTHVLPGISFKLSTGNKSQTVRSGAVFPNDSSSTSDQQGQSGNTTPTKGKGRLKKANKVLQGKPMKLLEMNVEGVRKQAKHSGTLNVTNIDKALKQSITKHALTLEMTQYGNKIPTIYSGINNVNNIDVVAKQTTIKNVAILAQNHSGNRLSNSVGEQIIIEPVTKKNTVKLTNLFEYAKTGDRISVSSGEDKDEIITSKVTIEKCVEVITRMRTGTKTNVEYGDIYTGEITSKQNIAKQIILSQNHDGNRMSVADGFTTEIDVVNRQIIPKDITFFSHVVSGEKIKSVDGDSYGGEVVSKEELLKQVSMLSSNLSGDKISVNSGNKLEVDVTTKNKTLKNVSVISRNKSGLRSSIEQGKLIQSFEIDSNAFNRYTLTVTPTHQYNMQKVTVTAKASQKVTGKWKFSLDGLLHAELPFSTTQDLSNISFDVDISKLVVGKNYCKIWLQYSNGDLEFLPMVITKEPYKCTIIERTITPYDGGYIYTNLYPLPSAEFISGFPGIVAFNNLQNGKVETTDITSIDLTKYSGINSINVIGDGCKILLSFDNKNTWVAFNGSQWNTVDSNLIATNGMTTSVVNTLTASQLSQIFNYSKLHFMAYVDGSLGSIHTSKGNAAYFKGLMLSLPANQAPIINNPTLNPTTLHEGTVNLTANIVDRDNDNVKYRITVNNVDFVPWTTTDKSTVDINVNIPEVLTPMGTHQISIEATDGLLDAKPYINFISRTNQNPTISGVLTELDLVATIGDVDNDDVKYRMSFNGKVVQDWTEFLPSPVNLVYGINPKEVIYKKENTLLIEYIDKFATEIQRCEFNFVGKRYITNRGFVMMI